MPDIASLIKYRTKKQSDGFSLISVLCVFIIIFISDDTLTFGATNNNFFIYFRLFIYSYLTIVLLRKVYLDNIKIPIYKYFFFLLLVLAIFLTAVVNVGFTGGYLYQIWIIFIAFLATSVISFSQFVVFFNKQIYILSLISLIIYSIAFLIPGLLEIFPVHENNTGTQFYNLGLGAIFLDTEALRNTGIFREPGVFVIFLVLALIFELFYKKTNIKYAIVIFLAFITTFSTAGYIVFLFVFLGYIFNKNKGLLIKVSFIVLITALLAWVSLYPDMTEKFLSKISEDSVDANESSLARVASVLVNFDIYSSHPFFGVGLLNYITEFSNASLRIFKLKLDASGLSTNTYMASLAVYGSFYGFSLIWGMFTFSKMINSSIISAVMIFFSLLLLFSNEDMRYSILFFSLVFYSFLRKSKGYINSQYERY